MLACSAAGLATCWRVRLPIGIYQKVSTCSSYLQATQNYWTEVIAICCRTLLSAA